MKINMKDRFLLSLWKTHCWGGERVHIKETERIREERGCTAPKVVVKLVPHDSSLNTVRHILNCADNTYRRLTLPSTMEGLRVVPLRRQVELVRVMKGWEEEFNEAVNTFMAEYEQLRAAAPTALGVLYDPEHWPSPSELKAKFSFKFELLPPPNDDSWAGWVEEVGAVATAALAEQLTNAAHRVISQSEKGKIRARTIEALCDLVQVAIDLDLKSDPVVSTALKRALNDEQPAATRDRVAALTALWT